jgi:esterase/lipase superfamily enzyme
MSNFMICVRNQERQNGQPEFGNEPGSATFLVIPDGATDFHPSDKVASDKTWLNKLLAERPGLKDILIYVHGYDMDRSNTLYRHNVLKDGLKKFGWDGEVITFAWPSGTKSLLYWEDRFDALNTAWELVDKGIKFFVSQMQAGCTINVHVIAHSTGALIVRESFAQAQTTQATSETNWSTSQMIFISGDVSSTSMEGVMSDAIYRHCVRFTNYFNPYDGILAISNTKRFGFENRVGRVGLPLASPKKAVDINCGPYYKENENNIHPVNAFKSHSWYFFDDTFLEDLAFTLKGELDREVIPTRELRDDGELYLKK